MCKELIRTAAEAEAEAEKAAAASVLVGMSRRTASSTSTRPGGPITTTTKPTEGVAKDAPRAEAEAASFGKLWALCAAANLVRSTTRRIVSLGAFHGQEARQEDALVEVKEKPVLEPPESAGEHCAVCGEATAPAPAAAAATAVDDAPACDAYKYRHSWRRRKAPVIVVAGRSNAPKLEHSSAPEPVGDVLDSYAFRHSWRRRRKVPSVVVVPASGVDDAAVTEATGGVVRSTGRRFRSARISVVVAGAFLGVCEAALVADNSVDEDDDDHRADSASTSSDPNAAASAAPVLGKQPVAVAVPSSLSSSSLEASDHLTAAACKEVVQPALRVFAESTREGWQERQRRRGRGERYAAFMAAALMSTPRRRHGGEGGRRRA
jgi:hypothetical protein